MIIRKVFISYNEADKKYANKIRLWAKRGLCCGSNQRVMTLVEREKTRPPASRQQAPPPSVGMKILMSDFVIVLIGNNNEQHPWLLREEIAAQKGIVRYFVRIPYTDGTLPSTLSGLKQLAYNPNALEVIFRDLPEKPEIVFKKAPFKKPHQGSGYPRREGNGQQQRSGYGQKREGATDERGGYQKRTNDSGEHGGFRKDYSNQRNNRPLGGGNYKPYHDRTKPSTGYIKRETPPPPPPPPPIEPPLSIRDNDIGLEW